MANRDLGQGHRAPLVFSLVKIGWVGDVQFQVGKKYARMCPIHRTNPIPCVGDIFASTGIRLRNPILSVGSNGRGSPPFWGFFMDIHSHVHAHYALIQTSTPRFAIWGFIEVHGLFEPILPCRVYRSLGCFPQNSYLPTKNHRRAQLFQEDGRVLGMTNKSYRDGVPMLARLVFGDPEIPKKRGGFGLNMGWKNILRKGRVTSIGVWLKM